MRRDMANNKREIGAIKANMNTPASARGDEGKGPTRTTRHHARRVRRKGVGVNAGGEGISGVSESGAPGKEWRDKVRWGTADEVVH